MEYKDCKSEFQRFLDIKYPNDSLENQLKYFKYFNFAELFKGHPKYKEEYKDFAAQTRSYNDGDDTFLARIIMYMVWGKHSKKHLPMLNSFDKIGYGKIYGGDTINTFNTLFSSDLHGIKKFLKYLPQKSDQDNYIKKIIHFEEIYANIGNFMLMPSNTIIPEGWETTTSINSYRGTQGGLFDYFDLFLNVYNNKSDKILNELMKKDGVNSFYFEKINTIDKFCEINYIDTTKKNGYPKDNNYIKYNHKPFYTYMHYGWKNEKDIQKDHIQYLNFATQYMEESEKIILHRAEKIIDEISKHYNINILWK
ncbi:hypothetical protein IJ182_10335 [bacterium]|nr:hypothetical protein [bacterium]